MQDDNIITNKTSFTLSVKWSSDEIVLSFEPYLLRRFQCAIPKAITIGFLRQEIFNRLSAKRYEEGGTVIDFIEELELTNGPLSLDGTLIEKTNDHRTIEEMNIKSIYVSAINKRITMDEKMIRLLGGLAKEDIAAEPNFIDLEEHPVGSRYWCALKLQDLADSIHRSTGGTRPTSEAMLIVLQRFLATHRVHLENNRPYFTGALQYLDSLVESLANIPRALTVIKAHVLGEDGDDENIGLKDLPRPIVTRLVRYISPHINNRTCNGYYDSFFNRKDSPKIAIEFSEKETAKKTQESSSKGR